MKNFYELKYPVTISVVINFGTFIFIDKIKGLNIGHALYEAKQNWNDAIAIDYIKTIGSH